MLRRGMRQVLLVQAWWYVDSGHHGPNRIHATESTPPNPRRLHSCDCSLVQHYLQVCAVSISVFHRS